MLDNIIKNLEQFDVPTISNAIDMLKIRDVNKGFCDASIKQIIPSSKTIIGYAATAKISSLQNITEEQKKMPEKLLRLVYDSQKPVFIVMEDIDEKPIGSFWGEVNANIYKALGCVGVITNGGVRDLKEVESLGFGYFASAVLVSRANVHIIDYNCPVKIGGLDIYPGDILAGDCHGVLSIPRTVIPGIISICRKALLAELPVLEGCRKARLSGNLVDIEELIEWQKEMNKLRTL